MLSFGDRGAAIVEAESMIRARLRVAVKGATTLPRLNAFPAYKAKWWESTDR